MFYQFIQSSIVFLNNISDVIPLPLFAFLGSIVEEIIAPIPSPLVMTLAGTLAGSNNRGWVYVGVIAFTAAIGKTAASYIMYVIADKGEDIVIKRFGTFLGLTHEKVESVGRHLNKGWRDDIVLILLRAVPIIPTAPVSIICGLVKLNVRTFITSTFIGVIIRNIFYLFLGYTGVNAVETIVARMEDFDVIGYLIIVVLIGVIIGYMYYQKYKELLFRKIFPNKEDEI